MPAHPCASAPLETLILVVVSVGVADLPVASTHYGVVVLGHRLCIILALGIISIRILADIHRLDFIVQLAGGAVWAIKTL